MARDRGTSSIERQRDGLYWIGYVAFAMAVMFLVMVIYAVVQAMTLSSGPPRTGLERESRVIKAGLEQYPTNAKLWGEYVRHLTSTGQFAAAERAVGEADKALKKRRSEVAIEWARLALAKGDLEEAVKRGEEAYKIAIAEREELSQRMEAKGVVAPPEPGTELDAALLLGEIHVRAKDTDSALKIYTEALELKPQMADVLLERAKLHVETGDTKKAIADLKTALKFGPDYEPALEMLAELEGQ